MIIKSFEINKINFDLNNFFLFYGKNNGFKKIAVEKIPNKGLGKTINDRLKRASKY